MGVVFMSVSVSVFVPVSVSVFVPVSRFCQLPLKLEYLYFMFSSALVFV